jgi:phosphoenolpyruvate carboxylase
MLGYSDSGKQVGFFASAIALRVAQRDLVRATTQAGVTLTLFHGRGGALGRGGGPESEAIRAQPQETIRGRLRVTEQGETVAARYGHPEIAQRDLELTVAAVLAADADVGADPVDDVPAVMRAAETARRAYEELTRDQDRLARYVLAATPIEEIARLPLGSRPASRGGTSLESLRAIPWVFSWTQSRHGLPGWFGVGTAIEALVAELGAERVRDLADRSRFLRALISSSELSLVRSDLDVAREYASLAGAEGAAIFELISAEHRRAARALSETLGRKTWVTSRPYLTESVARRNAYLDVLTHIQIEALRRRRADASSSDLLRRILFTTIGGIAAGLQTSG